jgi:hypothetical protein
MRRSNGVLSRESFTLPLASSLQLAHLARGSLPSDNYLTLTSSVTPVTFAATLPPGWSTTTLEPNGEDGLPRKDDPLGGLLTFGALRGIDAFGCGTLAGVHGPQHSKIASVSLLSTAEVPQPSSIVSIAVPDIDLSSVPMLHVQIAESGSVSLVAIAHYRGRGGRYSTSSIPLAAEDAGADVTLIPPDSSVPKGAVLTGVDLVASLQSGHDAVISNPRLTLLRAEVVPLRATPVGDVNRKPATLEIPRVASPARKSLVLDISDPNWSDRDLAFSTAERGVYLGRVAQLQVLAVQRVSDSYASVSMTSPVTLPYTRGDGWRQRVRVFADGVELRPAQSGEPLPGQFLFDGTNVEAIIPIAAINRIRDWRMVYLPPEWMRASRNAQATSELRIPLADGLTGMDGVSRPLGGTLRISPVSRTNTINPDSAPVSIRGAFIEELASRTAPPVQPALQLDGRRVDMHVSRYGWYESNVRLSAGDHHFADDARRPITALVLPSSIANADAPYGSDSSWSGTVSARISPHFSSAGGAVVLRQMFSPGWVATANGHTLPHFLADGYANGFLVPQNSGSVDIQYWPERLLVFSRWISVTALLVCTILIAALKVVSAVPYWKAKYVAS